MSEEPDVRSPRQIEADIARRRQDLALTLDEIAVRVHPKTIMGDAKARAASAVDRTTGRAHEAALDAYGRVHRHLVSPQGSLRIERVVPIAVAAVALVVAIGLSKRQRRGR